MATQVWKAERPGAAKRRVVIATVLALALVLGLMIVAVTVGRKQDGIKAAIAGGGNAAAPTKLPLPTVEPLVLDTSNPDEARRLNAQIAFSTAPNPAARPFLYKGSEMSLARATDCLAAAMIYEAGDDATGELAVGQVVLNRLRHPAFPKTVCGVVFQGQERATGCQFTFTCDGAMARIPNKAAWDRARSLASQMLSGAVFKPVGYSTHYHTDWVMPYWSSSLDKVVAIDTHLFFRWMGWWGTPGAFASKVDIAAEPAIIKLAALSPIHKDDATEFALSSVPGGSLLGTERPLMAIGPEQIGQRIGPGKLAAVETGGNGFVMTLDKGGDPARYAEAAAAICGGRAQCRLLAWTNPRDTPKTFPVPDNSLNSMSFSYIRQKESGFERMLYNCDEFPSAPRIQCMVRRTPVPGAPKLIADEKISKMRSPLPEAGKPAADMHGELEPTPSRVEVIKLKPKAEAPAGGGAAPGAP